MVLVAGQLPKRVAFITTPNFRKELNGVIESFIRRCLFRLTQTYQVISTHNTFELLERTRRKDISSLRKVEKDEIHQGMSIKSFTPQAYQTWQREIGDSIESKLPGASGVVEVLVELVEGRLAGVIHLTHPEDVEAKADSSVLWREANVHNVPIAHDISTAEEFITAWGRSAITGQQLAPVRLAGVLDGLEEEHETIAMISHDGKKLDMCEFAVANASKILGYDHVLATGTTGEKLKAIMLAQNPGADVSKVRCCLSGPKGGDIQIALAVSRGLCQKVIFFQDPATSHPHEVDIRLFERIVLDANIPVKLATNAAAAELIL